MCVKARGRVSAIGESAINPIKLGLAIGLHVSYYFRDRAPIQKVGHNIVLLRFSP